MTSIPAPTCLGPIEEIEAKDLKPDDYLLQVTAQLHKLPVPGHVTPAYLELAGYYMAEGFG
jgi:hypothetical protein